MTKTESKDGKYIIITPDQGKALFIKGDPRPHGVIEDRKDNPTVRFEEKEIR